MSDDRNNFASVNSGNRIGCDYDSKWSQETTGAAENSQRKRLAGVTSAAKGEAMIADELLDDLPPTVADLVRALLDVRTLSSGPASKKNNERINQVAGAAIIAFEKTISEME